MNYLILAAILLISPGLLMAADFNAGMDAYERQDYRTAFQEFSTLARAGDSNAQYMLGRMYAQGRGVVQDYVQAHKWYNLAASQGHRQAAQARDALAQRMTSEQTARAQRLAQEWQPEGEAPDSEPTAPPEKPSQQAVARIQRTLNELGYDAGPVDGRMGGKTRSAIRDYQADHDLAVTGQPSQDLLEHLRRTQSTAPTAQKPTEAPEPPAEEDQWPWRQVLLNDAFRDGDYTRNPSWTVAAGEFWVESGLGLRTVLEPPQPPAEADQEAQPPDLPQAIIGAILEEALPPKTGEAPPEEAPPGPPEYAEIYVDQTITNAFAIQLELIPRQILGPVVFGPYQGRERAIGYRLAYTPDSPRGLQLLRVTRSGSSVIESADQRFSPDRQYSLQWTRSSDGEMAVSVGGKELFRTVDRSFADSFDGFTLINRGGDYALREITIYGVD